jgi:redox-sensitive bicupin YhaK (pirin superfamily)
MITLRPSRERGRTQIGWLDSYHTFSFGGYQDDAHMGFRSLRVINDDRVAPGMGFGMHPHRDMEIITIVLKGELEHKDSLGTGSTIRPGEVQRMSAGTGIRHSEFNPSDSEEVHLLQIWILPDRAGRTPEYEEKTIEGKSASVKLVASQDGRDGGLSVHQDVKMYVGETGTTPVTIELAPGRYAWVHVIDDGVTLNDQAMNEGDGAAVSDEKTLRLTGKNGARFLVFDLA